MCFWGFSAAPGVYAREGNVDIAAFVWPPRLVSPPPPPLPPPLSLFDEATGSSTHRHHLLHHPQPFLLLFPSPPFLTTGLPCLSYPPSPHTGPEHPPTHHPRRILHARVTRDFVRSPLTKGGIFVRAAERRRKGKRHARRAGEQKDRER